MKRYCAAAAVLFVLAYAAHCLAQQPLADSEIVAQYMKRQAEQQESELKKTWVTIGDNTKCAIFFFEDSKMETAAAELPTELVIAGKLYRRTKLADEFNQFRGMKLRNAYYETEAK